MVTSLHVLACGGGVHMGLPGIQVDVVALRGIGQNVAMAAELVGRGAARSREVAPQAGDGWASVAQVHSAAAVWASYLQRLGPTLTGLGGDLIKAAESYRAADRAAVVRAGTAMRAQR